MTPQDPRQPFHEKDRRDHIKRCDSCAKPISVTACVCPSCGRIYANRLLITWSQQLALFILLAGVLAVVLRIASVVVFDAP